MGTKVSGRLVVRVLFLSLLLTLVSPHVSAKEKEAKDVVDRLFRTYDKRFRPNYGGAPVQIGVTGYVLEISEIDSAAMTMEIDLYFRQSWNDPRLTFNGNQSISLVGSHDTDIWTPDTFFVNAVEVKRQDHPVPNSFTRLSPNGDVLKSSRYIIELSCPMDLHYFPFDEQTCVMELESYGYTMNDVNYKWAEGKQSLTLADDVSDPLHEIAGYKVDGSQVSLVTGTYSRLKAHFWIYRESDRYVIEFFVPCIILTLIALLALLLADTKVATIVNTILLSISVLFVGLSTDRLEIPDVSYMTSIDTFAVLTYAFISLALILNTLEAYLFKAGDKLPETQPGEKSSVDLLSKIYPWVKVVVVGSYVLANLIYWVIHPFADSDLQDTDDDELLADGWTLL